jgi:TPR repeat protein
VLLRHDRPEQAWHWMQRVLHAGSRSTEEYFLGAVCLYQGLGRTHQRWQKGQQGPLFELPAEVTARGWELLEKAGVPRGAWSVALHAVSSDADVADVRMRADRVYEARAFRYGPTRGWMSPASWRSYRVIRHQRQPLDSSCFLPSSFMPRRSYA